MENRDSKYSAEILAKAKESVDRRDAEVKHFDPQIDEPRRELDVYFSKR